MPEATQFAEQSQIATAASQIGHRDHDSAHLTPDQHGACRCSGSGRRNWTQFVKVAWNFVRSGPVRLFALLLLSGLVPATALDLLFTARTRDLLTDQARSAVVEQAKAYAATTYDRLRNADEALQLVAAEYGARGSAAALPEHYAKPHFTSITWFSTTGQTVPLFGPSQALPELDGAAREHIARNEAVLLTAGARGGATQVFLLRPAAVGLLLAQFNSNDLWRNRGGFGDATNFCALDGRKTVLHCSAPQTAAEVERIAALPMANSFGELDWQTVNDNALGGYWRLSLQPRFAGFDWTILASQPKPLTVERFASVHSVYAYALVLSILISALLVALPARRSAKPAAAGAGRTPAAAPADAHAEAMPIAGVAEKSRRQTQAMSALSEIDRAILSRASGDRIIESVLRNAPAIITCDVLAVTLLATDARPQARTLVTAPGHSNDRGTELTALDADSVQFLAMEADGCWVQGPAEYPFLAPLAARGARRILLLPVFLDGKLAAILSAGLRERDKLADEDQTYARDFADRLGVALTAATRDENLYIEGHYDAVTSLPNRRFLKERVSEEIARAQREGRQIALLYVDLDEFKSVNDMVGHAGGDEVLEQASRRLKRALREEDVLARFGGDEFVVLLPGIAAGVDAGQVAEKLIATLAKPYSIGGNEYHLGASVGISVYPNDGPNVDQLLRNADFAMSRAKANGRRQYVFFEERMTAQVLSRNSIERDLRGALANNELQVFYQPQVDLRTGKMNAIEALVRWKHPKRGFVRPDEFIGIAEKSDLIEQLGQFVRRTACTQYRVWEAAGIAPSRISINVSSREIKRADFVAQIESVLRETGMRPFCLELEITESLLVDNSAKVLDSLKRLNEKGVRIALDDFGTGYSSMAYLKRLPFDVLKVDRAFVKDIGTADGSEAIINAIIGMAHSLGKEVVAEGIETEAQRVFLALKGCEVGQGFLWSQAVCSEEFVELNSKWVAKPQQRILSGVLRPPRVAR